MSHQPKCRECHKILAYTDRHGVCAKCERRLRGLPANPKCIHCGNDCKPDEGIVCEACYSKYTPGMLADLDQ